MKKSKLVAIIKEVKQELDESGKFAVWSIMSDSDAQYYTGQKEKTIEISFYNVYPPSGRVNDAVHTPRKLYLDVKNRAFDFKGKKAIKYGVLNSSNLGSFGEAFLKSKFKVITNLLQKNGWVIKKDENSNT